MPAPTSATVSAPSWPGNWPAPHDGRLSLVRLTTAGREELAAMEATFAGALTTHLLSLLSPGQVLSLGAIAHRLGAPNCRDLGDGGPPGGATTSFACG